MLRSRKHDDSEGTGTRTSERMSRVKMDWTCTLWLSQQYPI